MGAPSTAKPPLIWGAGAGAVPCAPRRDHGTTSGSGRGGLAPPSPRRLRLTFRQFQLQLGQPRSHFQRQREALQAAIRHSRSREGDLLARPAPFSAAPGAPGGLCSRPEHTNTPPRRKDGKGRGGRAGGKSTKAPGPPHPRAPDSGARVIARAQLGRSPATRSASPAQPSSTRDGLEEGMQSALPPPSPPLQFSPAMVAWLLLRLLLFTPPPNLGKPSAG